MITILKKQDKTYGGYAYVEFDTAKGIYQTGNSRAHRGHYSGNSISVHVTTLKELRQIETYLEDVEGYTKEEAQ